jgi:osmotically-inducible protein OsmY
MKQSATIILGIFFAILSTAVAAAGGAGEGPATGPTGRTPEAEQAPGDLDEPNDQEITEDIRDQLYWDSRVDSDNITVQVNNGMVLLNGVVDTARARRAAEDDAWAIPGVVSVDNQIEVDATRITPTDEFIRQNVQTVLELNPNIDEGEVGVSVEDGEVTLRGEVQSAWRRARATELVQDITGVAGINNRLEVVPEEEISDAALAEAVRSSLERTNAVDADDIRVGVEDGRVILNGTVATLRERNAAFDAALLTAGVRDVENKLSVRAEAAEGITDADVRRNVIDQLVFDDRVDAADISVSADGGVVRLEGEVDSYFERQAAEESASLATGVASVENDLTVNVSEAPSNDRYVERNVRQAFRWNPDLNLSNIEVTIEEGVVALEGTVDAFWKLEIAEDAAANIAGVLGVENNLAVVPESDREDEIIAEDIVATLERNVLVDSDAVTVSVEDGVVTLSGTVDSVSERDAAYDAAAFTFGVVDVIDQMNVE